MRDKEEIERLLASVPVPALREGPHREQLKTQLLHPTEPSQRKGEEPMRVTERLRMTRMMRVAAAMLIASLLLATGWAAEKVYQRITKRVVLEEYDLPSVESPDGLGGWISRRSTSTVITQIPEDAPPGSEEKAKVHHEMMKQLIAEKKYKFLKALEIPPDNQTQYLYQFTFPDGERMGMNFSMRLEDVASWDNYVQKRKEQVRQQNEDSLPGIVERAKRHREERKQLIAEKKYKLISTFESPPGGLKQYVYQFTYADGEQSGINFSMPLEDVTSWEDYLQKSKEQKEQRNEEISKAIAVGSFRLLNVKPLSTHVCRDVQSNQKLLVQKIRLPDGKEIASVRRDAAGPTEFQTSWLDHLQAIRQGERVLLDLQIIKNYTYEITLFGGSTTIHTYAGYETLKKP